MILSLSEEIQELGDCFLLVLSNSVVDSKNLLLGLHGGIKEVWESSVKELILNERSQPSVDDHSSNELEGWVDFLKVVGSIPFEVDVFNSCLDNYREEHVIVSSEHSDMIMWDLGVFNADFGNMKIEV